MEQWTSIGRQAKAEGLHEGKEALIARQILRRFGTGAERMTSRNE